MRKWSSYKRQQNGLGNKGSYNFLFIVHVSLLIFMDGYLRKMFVKHQFPCVPSIILFSRSLSSVSLDVIHVFSCAHCIHAMMMMTMWADR